MELLTTCPICSAEKLETFITCKDFFLTKESFIIVQCTECGFKFTNPRPEASILGDYYKSPDYISHSNSRKGLFNLVYQEVRKVTLNRKYNIIAKNSKGSNILDIGCATGEFLNLMKTKGWETTGIEPDRMAREQAVKNYGLAVFDESQLNRIPENSLDVITLWHVLEHVSNLQDRMQSIGRLLKPGGLLVIAVPNADSFDAKSYKEYWAGYDVPRHLYHFSKTSLSKLIKQFGFAQVVTLPMKFDSYYVSLLSEKYRSGKMKWIGGLLNGFRSNWNARKSGDFSSLIYISKKQ